eukprot:6165847-Pyramimonas_sp.AAC.1
MRSAELREDEEDLDKHSPLHKCRVGRATLQKMGWKAGDSLGRTKRADDGEALRANETTSHHLGRCEKAGPGSAAMEADEGMGCRSKLPH